MKFYYYKINFILIISIIIYENAYQTNLDFQSKIINIFIFILSFAYE